MKIGIYFTAAKGTGGVYQYSLTFLEALKSEREHDYVVFNLSPDFPAGDFNLPNWKIVHLIPQKTDGEKDKSAPTKHVKPSFKRRIITTIRSLLEKLHLYSLERWLTTLNEKKRARIVRSHKPDLMFFPQPSEVAFLSRVPAVVAVHSLEHRVNPEFPEVSKKGQYGKREYLYKNITRTAYKMLVDALTRREEILTHYPWTKPESIVRLPYLPPDYLRTDIGDEEKAALRKKYNLPERFVFYPAQFWPHKNHRRLMRALRILKDKGLVVPIVLTGTKKSEWGEYDKIMALIDELNINEQIYNLGYVDNDEIGILYSMAVALVMPTYFGPTPIPMIEGWKMNCPVVFSEIKGCRERARDAILTFNLEDPADIAEKIEMIWTNENLRQDLVRKGQERLTEWTRDDFIAKIGEIVEEFKKDFGK
jgi:glycosyltransferase involved in cell wall biosynthesis